MSLSPEQAAKYPKLAEICKDLYLYASIATDNRTFRIDGDNLVILNKNDMAALIAELQSIHSEMKES